MDFEFDKEMDLLLRQAAQSGEAATDSAGAHLDADEIAAFAERALTEKARLHAVRHFADCSRCRKILSNLIAFDDASESETVHTEEKSVLPGAAIPWYRKLFAFPQIAYAMGALALIFGGIIAVIVLKDSSQNTASDIAQIERQADERFSPAAAPLSNMANSQATTANANMTANTAGNASSNATMAAPKPTGGNQTGAAANSNLAQSKATEAANSAADKNITAEPVKKERRAEDEMVAAAPPPAKAAGQNTYTVNGATIADAAKQAENSQNTISQNQSANPSQVTAPDVQSLPINGRSTQSLRMQRPAEKADSLTKDDKSAVVKTVGGKDFRRADGVWYDTEYRNQKTINLRRGTDEYKKLEQNLRAIADQLGGVVVIVSAGKAYRIQ